jgi:hypothetical protein
MEPNAHLLHYAIGPSGEDVNFLAVVERPATWTHENWVVPVPHDEAAAAFSGWHPAVVEMTGIPQCVRSLSASLPRTIAEKPWRPREAMTIRSQPLDAAVSMMTQKRRVTTVTDQAHA